MERLAGRADAVTVASRFLEPRFGGTLIPHVRDTEAWDPARYDAGAGRRDLGADGRPVVMFLGTPRAYKGIDDLVEAVAQLRGDVLLAIVGVKPGSADAARWASRSFVRLVGEIPSTRCRASSWPPTSSPCPSARPATRWARFPPSSSMPWRWGAPSSRPRSP